MNKTYENIVNTMPPGLERQVMKILAGCIGKANRISRYNLAHRCFPGVILSVTSLANCAEDRKVRKAIENLQGMGYPILSNSGEGGYYLPADQEELDAYLAEIESRVEKLRQKALNLRKAYKTVWKEPAKAEQLKF